MPRTTLRTNWAVCGLDWPGHYIMSGAPCQHASACLQVKQATEVQQFDPIHNGGPGASSWVLKVGGRCHHHTRVFSDRVMERLA